MLCWFVGCHMSGNPGFYLSFNRMISQSEMQHPKVILLCNEQRLCSYTGYSLVLHCEKMSMNNISEWDASKCWKCLKVLFFNMIFFNFMCLIDEWTIFGEQFKLHILFWKLVHMIKQVGILFTLSTDSILQLEFPKYVQKLLSDVLVNSMKASCHL